MKYELLKDWLNFKKGHIFYTNDMYYSTFIQYSYKHCIFKLEPHDITIMTDLGYMKLIEETTDNK